MQTAAVIPLGKSLYANENDLHLRKFIYMIVTGACFKTFLHRNLINLSFKQGRQC